MPTLSTLIASGSSVRWKCQECQASGLVDLPALMAGAGDIDLSDRHPPCKAPGCTYWVGFYAQQGMRNTPLRTEAGMLREMDRRTEWLRKVGRIGYLADSGCRGIGPGWTPKKTPRSFR